MGIVSENAAATYLMLFATKAANIVKFVRAKSPKDKDEEMFYNKLTAGLNQVLVGGYYKHFNDIIMQKDAEKHAYCLIGKTFLHVDCKTGNVHIITAVSRSASKWYHNVVTGYQVKYDGLCTTKPHGWTDSGYNAMLQREFLNLYWSHNGQREHKHSYLQCPSVQGLYVSADVGRIIIALDQMLDIGDFMYTNEVVKEGVNNGVIVSSY